MGSRRGTVAGPDAGAQPVPVRPTAVRVLPDPVRAVPARRGRLLTGPQRPAQPGCPSQNDTGAEQDRIAEVRHRYPGEFLAGHSRPHRPAAAPR
jgi:hypothetical protein